jgi:acetyltransferase-like isoleucine patch superfamily enzyme
MGNFFKIYLPLEDELFKYTDDFYIYPLLKPLLLKLINLKSILESNNISIEINLITSNLNRSYIQKYFDKILDNINILIYEDLNLIDNKEEITFIVLPANTPLISYNIDIILDFIIDNQKKLISHFDKYLNNSIELHKFSFAFKSESWEIIENILTKKIFNFKELREFLIGFNENYVKSYTIYDKDLSNYFLRINSLKDFELIFEESKKIVKNIYKDVVLLGNNIFICPLSNINKENFILDNVFIINSIIEGNFNKIGPNCFIINSRIGSKNNIVNSFIKDNVIIDNNKIGPFSNLRENNEIIESNKIGAFVELKNAKISFSVKCSHLAYLGDCIIKENVNIGAGVVLANYDGVNKYQTIIESNSFIGSNSTIISPRNIGGNAYIGAGSVVTKDVESNTVVFGNPAKFYTTTENLKLKKISKNIVI